MCRDPIDPNPFNGPFNLNPNQAPIAALSELTEPARSSTDQSGEDRSICHPLDAGRNTWPRIKSSPVLPERASINPRPIPADRNVQAMIGLNIGRQSGGGEGGKEGRREEGKEGRRESQFREMLVPLRLKWDLGKLCVPVSMSLSLMLLDS